MRLCCVVGVAQERAGRGLEGGGGGPQESGRCWNARRNHRPAQVHGRAKRAAPLCGPPARGQAPSARRSASRGHLAHGGCGARAARACRGGAARAPLPSPACGSSNGSGALVQPCLLPLATCLQRMRLCVDCVAGRTAGGAVPELVWRPRHQRLHAPPAGPCAACTPHCPELLTLKRGIPRVDASYAAAAALHLALSTTPCTSRWRPDTLGFDPPYASPCPHPPHTGCDCSCCCASHGRSNCLSRGSVPAAHRQGAAGGVLVCGGAGAGGCDGGHRWGCSPLPPQAARA